MFIWIKSLVVLVSIILLPFSLFSFLAFGINTSQDSQSSSILVLGAGVINGKPSRILQLRLDKAVEVYKNHKILSVVVSGDNRDIYYNEPKVMKDYLVALGVPESVIVTDPLGIRTIDSCHRAFTVYKLEKIYLVSQAYHLARATTLCRREGLIVVPAVALDSCNPIICSQILREIPASWLALLNLVGFNFADF